MARDIKKPQDFAPLLDALLGAPLYAIIWRESCAWAAQAEAFQKAIFENQTIVQKIKKFHSHFESSSQLMNVGSHGTRLQSVQQILSGVDAEKSRAFGDAHRDFTASVVKEHMEQPPQEELSRLHDLPP